MKAYVLQAPPSLSDIQKKEIKSLMDDYYSNKIFKYDGDVRRESYAYSKSVSSLTGFPKGCMYKGKYLLNCGVFAQMIWMGRSISDFTSKPNNEITKEFDWGYYFDFIGAKKSFGVTKDNGAYYSSNTYTNNSGTTTFVTYDNAAAMAQELYKKGYEIPYSDVEVGDLVFYRSTSISDNDNDSLEQTSFRYITHVAVVYDVDPEYGPIVIECSDAYATYIGKAGLSNNLTKFGIVRGVFIDQRVVMAARHPAAFGVQCNVPDKFSVYRGTEAKE